jgi:hypothetical protein
MGPKPIPVQLLWSSLAAAGIWLVCYELDQTRFFPANGVMLLAAGAGFGVCAVRHEWHWKQILGSILVALFTAGTLVYWIP